MDQNKKQSSTGDPEYGQLQCAKVIIIDQRAKAINNQGGDKSIFGNEDCIFFSIESFNQVKSYDGREKSNAKKIQEFPPAACKSHFKYEKEKQGIDE